MREVKDTVRSLVRIGFDGTVWKTFRGHLAQERFDNEVRVLRHLEEQGCTFVPKILTADAEELRISTTNVGRIVERLDQETMKGIFTELEAYGVRHQDQAVRNITYSMHLGRFCVIDFEFSMLLAPGSPPPSPPPKPDAA